MAKTKFVTIIMTHYAMDEVRSALMRQSLDNLIRTLDYPSELIVVDNGGNIADSQHFLDYAHAGKINTYIRNSNNMHFSFARNQAIKLAHGNYICIIDNDILYTKGWLSKCVDILERNPKRKIYTTPLGYPTPVLRKKYHQGWLKYKGERCELNMRAGSNCFVIRKKDLMEIGMFPVHRIGGSYWTNNASRAGYLACVLPSIYAQDVGLRRGYNLSQSIPINLTLSNDAKIYFNRDEFQRLNPDLEYYNVS